MLPSKVNCDYEAGVIPALHETHERKDMYLVGLATDDEIKAMEADGYTVEETSCTELIEKPDEDDDSMKVVAIYLECDVIEVARLLPTIIKVSRLKG